MRTSISMIDDVCLLELKVKYLHSLNINSRCVNKREVEFAVCFFGWRKFVEVS